MRRLTVVAAVLVLAAALVAHEVGGVRASAQQARTSLADGLAAVDAGDLHAAREHLERVETHLAAALAGTDRVVWRSASDLPGLGDDLATAERTLTTARVAAALADDLAAPLGSLARPDGTTRIRDAQGALDLRPVREAMAGLATIDVDPLRGALARLEATPVDGVAATIRDARAEALDQGRRLLGLAQDVSTVAKVLPSFLGLDGPREYFLAMQNVAEVRGTGGLIGFFATVRIGQGRIELTQPERYEVLDQSVAQGPVPPIAPETLPAGFLDRYGQFDSTSFLANANLDPDFPTVARILLNLYEEQRGQRLDGVIAMDPIALAYAHIPIGPVELADDVVTGQLPRSIRPDALARVLMIDAYDVLGGPSEHRKAYLARVAEAAFRGVTSGDWSALSMSQWLAQAAGRGHLQLYSEDTQEQEVLTGLGLAGEFARPDDHDLLAVTANNSGGNKMDVHVGHTIRADVRLEPSGTDGLRRTAVFQVAVDNPLPTSGRDVYIIGTHKPNLGFVEFFTDTAGLNRTWFTAWAPETVTDVQVTDARGEAVTSPRQHRVHGLIAVDHVLDTPSEEQRSFEVRLSGPATAEAQPDGSRLYRLAVPRQPKGIPDRLELRLSAPDGWRVELVHLEDGSQDVPLFGVHGEIGPPVTATSTDGALVVAGDRSRDVNVEVRLVPLPTAHD